MKTYNNVCDLATEMGCDNLNDIGQSFYNNTECGVSTQFITKNGDAWNYSDLKLPVIMRALPNILAANKITGIKFATIVEGSDAEFSAGVINFPCTQSEIDDALIYLEKLVDEAWEGM